MLLLLTGCVQEKPVIKNVGYDEITSYLQTNNLTNNTLVDNVTGTVESEAPVIAEEIQSTGWFDKVKKVGKTIMSLFDKVVTGLFGKNGWYLIAAALVLIIIFRLLGTIGAVIMFLIIMYVFLKVLN